MLTQHLTYALLWLNFIVRPQKKTFSEFKIEKNLKFFEKKKNKFRDFENGAGNRLEKENPRETGRKSSKGSGGFHFR